MAIQTIKVTAEIAEILAENLVEYNQAQKKSPIKAGTEITVDDGAPFEAFTRHPNKRIISAGAFTHIVDAENNFFMFKTGRYCSIARGTRIVNGHHPIHSVTTNPFHYGEYYKENLPPELRYTGPVETFTRSYGRGKIGNDVWLGAYCIIRSGVSIGDGAVVASGSVIMKDVPPYTIVGGNPAKKIRPRFPQEITDRLIDLKWWQYCPSGFRDLDMFDVCGFLDSMDQRKAANELKAFTPTTMKFMNGSLVVV
ncbi:CatB-related O-acetyltransferase [Thioclava indica]|uniref:Acetyltransferase n=1 Tax=Thioclava indica TaxID=1353528 RepID=A0A074JXN0_9RHOB|nr:CatB-related O-acetyltransferase [Thioclava indica]KEO61239.1 hypothetical protein DT23_10075 [Thioclava indica]